MKIEVLNITKDLKLNLNFKSKQLRTIYYKVRKNAKKVVNWDWIEFTCYKKNTEQNLEINIPFYSLEQLEFYDSYFKNCYSLKYNDKEIAIIKDNPKLKNLDPKYVRIKVSNEILYTFDYFEKIKSIISVLNLTFQYYNRLDVALDFNELDNGNTFEDLAEHLFLGTYRMKGYKTKSFNKNTIQSKSDEIQVTQRGNKINGFSVGSRRSDNFARIYNKTLEMKQKKEKQYISELWRINGIDINKDVYRFEISIKKNSKKAKFMTVDENGEIINESNIFFELETVLKQHEIFETYYNNYYSIVENNEKRFDRCTPIEIINTIELHTNVIMSIDTEPNTKYSKGVISSIVKMYNKIDTLNYSKKEIEYMLLLLKELLRKMGLFRWFKNKFPEIILPQSENERTNKQISYFDLKTLQTSINCNI